MNKFSKEKFSYKPNIYVEISNETYEIPYDKYQNVSKFKVYFKKNKYKIQFIFSFCSAILLLIIFSLNIIKTHSQEKISKNLLANYKLTTLYNNNLDQKYSDTYNSPFVLGIIKINKIDLNYPILSQTNEELLKISVCKFTGPLPNEVGNLCIVGHNYINNIFFSRINELIIGDEIEIYDLNGNKLLYTIYDKQEIIDTDLSCTKQDKLNQKIITLITCSNSNSNTRLVIKAKNKEI